MGAPGSGKTHFAIRFCRDYPVIHLSSDDIRARLFPKPGYTRAENEVVFQTLKRAATTFMRNRSSVFYDANNNQLKYRLPSYKLARKLGATCTLLWFQVPEDTAVERTTGRSVRHEGDPRFIDIPEQIVRNKAQALMPPGPREPHLVIDGTAPYEEQATRVAAHLDLTHHA